MKEHCLTINKEDKKLAKLKYDGKCALDHTVTTTDATGRAFVLLSCPRCDGLPWCRKLARSVENQLNMGV